MSRAPLPPGLLRNRDFVLLLGGSAASMFGDQFTLVALPLLVLALTASPAALGTVLATVALPRAALILLGGALVDRLSPRRVLLCARAANALCVTALAIMTLSGDITLVGVHVIALGIGVSTAFAYPAGSAILPQIVPREHLAAGNSLALTARQASFFVGPALAALVVGRGGAAHHVTQGLGVAFAIDAASFVLSLASLAWIRASSPVRTSTPANPARQVLASVAEGIRALWRDAPLRTFVIYSTTVMLLVAGPIQVGLPLLATTRLDMGDASLGVLMAANGAGMLVGGLSTGLILRHARDRLGIVVIGIDIVLGVAVGILGYVHATWSAAALLAATGALGGFGQIGVVTWIQRRVPADMMGRAMSVLMVLGMSATPLSAIVAGTLLSLLPLSTLFIGTGVVLSATAALGLLSRPLRSLGSDVREAALTT